MQYKGPGLYGLNPPLWVSGETIAQGQWLTSPADHEIYQRITATGGGTTDPADDTTNYVARSYVRTVALNSLRLVIATSGGITNSLHGATKVTLGAITVGTRTAVLDVTGRGALDFFGTVKAATGTWRVEVIVDGRAVLDETVTTAANQAQLVVGSSVSTGSGYVADTALPSPVPVQFKRSLQLYVTPVTTASVSATGAAYIIRSEA